jgi:uncharacterized damage-inducible protein DinB
MDHSLHANYTFMAQYNRWFNQRLYDACEILSDADRKKDRGAFFGSIHHTLTHLVLADKMWLQRFANQGIAFAALAPALLHHRGQVTTLPMQAVVDVGVTDLIALVNPS